MADIAVKIENVSKEYRLGTIGSGTLKGDLQSLMARLRGRDDPNTKIGASHPDTGRFLALDGINLEFYKGEAVGIIGKNGAGKSTLLKLLSQITEPSRGRIYLNGRVAAMLEVGTGFHSELTGRENIYLNGAVLGMTRAEIDRKFDEIVEFSEIEQFIDTPVKRYSSGMYVKLAFSVSAHLESEIMLMDEILAVGDAAFRQKCLSKMADISSGNGRTVLYVSHNMSTVRRLCSRCVVLDCGRVIFEGDADSAISIYLGSAARECGGLHDLTDVKRSRRLPLSPAARLCSIYMEDGIAKGGRLRLSLKLDVPRERDGIFVRFGVKSADMSPVASAVWHGAAEKSGTVEKDLEIDVSALCAGAYRLSVAVYANDEFGSMLQDSVLDACGFMLPPTGDGLDWRGAVWGSVRLPDVVEI